MRLIIGIKKSYEPEIIHHWKLKITMNQIKIINESKGPHNQKSKLNEPKSTHNRRFKKIGA